MTEEVDWIRAALAADRTKTQTGLARALRLDKSAVSRLLQGQRRLKFEEARLAAAYLGVAPPASDDPPRGFADESAGFDHAGPATAPIVAAAAEADGVWRIRRAEIIERRPRAPQLIGVDSVFGLYAPDAAAAPRFRIGEVAWINSGRPAAPGDDALFIGEETDAGAAAILGQLIRTRASHFEALRFDTGETRRLAVADWRVFHVYPRS